jgi:ABC-type bacteriocin/lantibiotic exporter with double-glycine peptidase domain
MTDNAMIKSPPAATRALLLGIWGHLNRRRRVQFGLLLLVMLASGGAEVVSLGAVLPFLAVLSDPERLWQQSLVQALAARVGFTAASQLVLPATLTFAAAAVLAALIRLANLWLNGRLAAAVGADLSCEAYRRTLYQPYEVHLQRNSAATITGNTTKITSTVLALTALLQLTTAALVAVGLLAGLLLIDWPVALGAAALFGSAYGLFASTARKELNRNSQLISAAAIQQIKALQEGLGAIRDVLLDSNQDTYVTIYRQADLPQRQLMVKNQFLSIFPRYTVECLGLVAIALLGGLLVFQQEPRGAVIPLLGAFALGAQRLLPALQTVYKSWSLIKGYNADLAGVLEMLNQPLAQQVQVVEPLVLYRSITFAGVHFRYGQHQPDVLQGLDFEIRRGERIGLIGRSGSGKSTTVDLLMGLLVPTAGMIRVDGADLHDSAHPERLVAWRAAIAHVPQNIYLADSSIAENIAFGVPLKNIDLARVKHAAEQAQIAGFIEASPKGYASFVGERGIRLSGGQRQRIGIARALYKQAHILVFDEATSALDANTETSVMEAIENLSRDLTLVMIAHRLSTIARCDHVFELGHGTVKRIIESSSLKHFRPS